MSSKNVILDRARKQVEAQMKQLEDERRQRMMKKRMEFIANGVRAAEQKKYPEAVVNYQSFIKLLEDWKGVPQGTLSPNHFDFTKEMSDMLVLAGIYWDLAKTFDHTDSPDKRKLFLHYLEKFILFSKGMTWQALCAEQLRRYLLTSRPKHRAEFKNAYKLIGSQKCFVLTALSDHTEFETIHAFRRFRDETLMRTFWGRAFVRAYYAVGPFFAQIVCLFPDFLRKRLASAFDRLALVIR